eukprot:1152316-Pelagomonas_calceolata.AAC.8
MRLSDNGVVGMKKKALTVAWVVAQLLCWLSLGMGCGIHTGVAECQGMENLLNPLFCSLLAHPGCRSLCRGWLLQGAPAPSAYKLIFCSGGDASPCLLPSQKPHPSPHTGWCCDVLCSRCAVLCCWGAASRGCGPGADPRDCRGRDGGVKFTFCCAVPVQRCGLQRPSAPC